MSVLCLQLIVARHIPEHCVNVINSASVDVVKWYSSFTRVYIVKMQNLYFCNQTTRHMLCDKNIYISTLIDK